MAAKTIEKSEGHLDFIRFNDQVCETYQIVENVYYAPISSPVMPDGYRTGRWLCFAWRYDSFIDVYNIETITNPEGRDQ